MGRFSMDRKSFSWVDSGDKGKYSWVDSEDKGKGSWVDSEDIRFSVELLLSLFSCDLSSRSSELGWTESQWWEEVEIVWALNSSPNRKRCAQMNLAFLSCCLESYILPDPVTCSTH